MENKKGAFCMAAGFLLVLAALLLTGYNVWDEGRAGDAADATFQALKFQTEEGQEELPEYILPDYLVDPRFEMPTVEIDGYDYIGYLDIPSLELSLPVMSEWSYPQLKIAPCRYAGSVYLDDMILAAHNYDRHFGRLKNLEGGELVRFTDVDGNVFDFSVTELELLWPEQTEEMLSGEWDLTLFTCTLGGRQRVTVRCDRIEDMAG
ncbi:sortase [uncultured Oscillibacter sp.]|uniref:sortase n=1 Tax=uncultured Oscillibacter sp. TaxID=876091 RepID=UPI0025DA4F1D|nr:sortase [uncultured Oscillibacter sp.]